VKAENLLINFDVPEKGAHLPSRALLLFDYISFSELELRDQLLSTVPRLLLHI
jgi:hypothetical protein